MNLRKLFGLIDKAEEQPKNYENDYKLFKRDRENMRKIIYKYRKDERDFFCHYEFLYKDDDTGKIYDEAGKDLTEIYKDKIKS